MKNQIFLAIVLLVFGVFTCPIKAQGENVNAQDTKISCKFTLRRIKDGACRVKITPDGLIINVKGQEFNIPNKQILAISSYELKNVVTVREYANIFLIVDPESKSDNRTDVLSISTNSVFGIITNSKSYSDLIGQLTTRLNGPRENYFDETVPLKLDNSKRENQISQQLQQLLTTKVCIRCDLRNANLEGVNLKKANLEGSILEGANLSNAKLDDAYLVGANLKHTNLYKTKFVGALLYHVSMEKANLEKANLVRANLLHGDISGANIKDAMFCGTVLPGGASLDSPNYLEKNNWSCF